MYFLKSPTIKVEISHNNVVLATGKLTTAIVCFLTRSGLLDSGSGDYDYIDIIVWLCMVYGLLMVYFYLLWRPDWAMSWAQLWSKPSVSQHPSDKIKSGSLAGSSRVGWQESLQCFVSPLPVANFIRVTCPVHLSVKLSCPGSSSSLTPQIGSLNT